MARLYKIEAVVTAYALIEDGQQPNTINAERYAVEEARHGGGWDRCDVEEVARLSDVDADYRDSIPHGTRDLRTIRECSKDWEVQS